MSVTVDIAGHVRVVLKELLRSDFSISFGAVDGVMVLLKGLEELEQNLVFGLLARLDFWVHTSVITLFNVFERQDAVTCVVYLFESLDADVGSEFVQRADHHSHEFVEVNFAIATVIENLEKCCDVFWIDLYAEVVDGLGKLVLVKRA